MSLPITAALLFCAPQAAGIVAIENVSVIEPGEPKASAGRTVVIENGVFRQVGDAKRMRVPSGATRIDGTGKFLIPGLWDMHVHWYDESALGLFTANGVTGIRIMFGSPMHKAWKERSALGERTGPRIVLASPIVDGPKPIWPGSHAIADSKDAPALVDRLKSEGWDFIKTYSLMPRDAYLELAKRANAAGVPFAGHVPYSVGLLEAARLGHRSNEHLGGILLELDPRAAELRPKLEELISAEQPMREIGRLLGSVEGGTNSLDAARLKSLAKELATTKMWQCPTLVVLRAMAHLDQESFTKDERVKYMPAMIRSMWNPANDFRLRHRTEAQWQVERDQYKLKLALIKPLKDAGNRFLAGTDCLNPYCFPGFSLHDELALLVEAGLSPTEALEAATINPARFLGEEAKWGGVAAGKRADAVLLERDPLGDIRNTTSIHAVVQGGKVFSRVELDAMLKANEKPVLVSALFPGVPCCRD